MASSDLPLVARTVLQVVHSVLMPTLVPNVGPMIGISQMVSAAALTTKWAGTEKNATLVTPTNTGVSLCRDAWTALPTAPHARTRKPALYARHPT